MKARLFVLVTVSEQPSNQMNNKVGRTAMTRMLNLRDVFELVNNRAFAHQEFIREMHEMILHVFAQARDEMESLLKKQFGQRGRDVAAIPNELAPKPLDHLRNRSAVIDVAWSQAAREQLAAIVARQVQFEAKEPPHR